MSAKETSSLTVAKLKALCILNDLPTSGKKSDLVERLLEFGLSAKEVGLPGEEKFASQETASEKKTQPEATEEVVLSLEDEDTLTPVIDTSESNEASTPDASPKEQILEAEILDAEFTPAEPKKSEKSVDSKSRKKELGESPSTLLDIVRKPQLPRFY